MNIGLSIINAFRSWAVVVVVVDVGRQSIVWILMGWHCSIGCAVYFTFGRDSSCRFFVCRGLLLNSLLLLLFLLGNFNEHFHINNWEFYLPNFIFSRWYIVWQVRWLDIRRPTQPPSAWICSVAAYFTTCLWKTSKCSISVDANTHEVILQTP